jgi:hypothetical protein
MHQLLTKGWQFLGIPTVAVLAPLGHVHLLLVTKLVQAKQRTRNGPRTTNRSHRENSDRASSRCSPRNSIFCYDLDVWYKVSIAPAVLQNLRRLGMFTTRKSRNIWRNLTVSFQSCVSVKRVKSSDVSRKKYWGKFALCNFPKVMEPRKEVSATY